MVNVKNLSLLEQEVLLEALIDLQEGNKYSAIQKYRCIEGACMEVDMALKEITYLNQTIFK